MSSSASAAGTPPPGPGGTPSRRSLLTAGAWAVPAIALSVATPSAVASAVRPDLELEATAPALTAIGSGGGTSPFTLTLTELAGAASTGPIAVYLTRLNPPNGYATLTDTIAPDAVDGWTHEMTADSHIFTYAEVIGAKGSSSIYSGTWTIGVSPPGLVTGHASATIAADSGGDSNPANNAATLPFATTNRISLGAAANYGVLGKAALTDDGASTFDGRIGFEPGAALVGFSPDAQTHFGPAAANAGAEADTLSARSAALALTPGGELPGQLGGTRWMPGVYHSTAAIGITGAVTLDAGGDPEGVFVFQIPDAALTTAAASSIVLTGGARATNVFWVVGAAVTLGAASTFVGTALVGAAVTAGAGARIDGRMLAPDAAVTLSSNVVTLPA